MYQYDLRLIPDLKDTFTTDGHVKIHFKSHGSDKIRLHAKELIIDETSVMVSDPKYSVIGHEYDLDREFYVIHLSEELVDNTDYTLDIDFTSILNDQLSGNLLFFSFFD